MLDSNIIADARAYALAEIEKFGRPPLELFKIAETKGIELAYALKADLDLVYLGLYLMDIQLGQATADDNGNNHSAMGAKATRKFLDQYDLELSFKEKVVNCVEAHHATVPYTSLEAEICANADCYKFLSPRGLFSFFHALGERGIPFGQALKIVEDKIEEKYKILSLDICKQELEPYYQNFKTFLSVTRQEK